MQDRRELIKAIVEAVGPLIDAKNETLKTVLMAEIKATREDIKRVEKKLDEKLVDHENRISQLEEDANIPQSH